MRQREWIGYLSAERAARGVCQNHQMRVVTFNIRYGTADDGPFEWKHRRDGLHQMLLALDADVFCFQEALHSQVNEIAEWLTPYSWVGVGRDDGRSAGEYAPIFIKGRTPLRSDTFWLSPFPDIPGSCGWGAKHARICTWADLGGLVIANVHLDHESALARQEGAAVALDRIFGRSILCGDFNADLNEELFFDAVFQAGFQDLAPDSGETYNGFDREPSKRIDYVFGREIVAVSSRVIRSPMVSDHWPVVVDVK
jgi:endonuclease/exonuclease/phosphatase family metal-dependent hydrolase